MFTVQEAAVELKMSVWFLRDRIKKGDIKTTKMGSKYRISEEEVERIKKEGI